MLSKVRRPTNHRKFTAESVICPKKTCAGILFDVTPGLVAALGVKHVQCSACKQCWAFKIRDLEITP